ncbi:MAG: hypothetical protein ACQGVK_13355 [Myxococcota bacterium]
MKEWPLRAVRWSVLGGWVGSWGLFALVVAPTAFRVLEGADEASRLIGPVLRSLHLYGLAAGLVLALVARVGGQRAPFWIAPLVLAALCAATEFGVTGSLDGIRPHELGADSAPDAAGRFAQLHRISQAIFAAVWLGAIGLVVAHAREDAANPGGARPQPLRKPVEKA